MGGWGTSARIALTLLLVFVRQADANTSSILGEMNWTLYKMVASFKFEIFFAILLCLFVVLILVEMQYVGIDVGYNIGSNSSPRSAAAIPLQAPIWYL